MLLAVMTHSTAAPTRWADHVQEITIRGYFLMDHMRQRLRTHINLDSRRGEGGVLWSILAIAMVAVVASVSIIVIGPKLKELGTTAADKVQAIPANWP
jgi:hypothetical protein